MSLLSVRTWASGWGQFLGLVGDVVLEVGGHLCLAVRVHYPTSIGRTTAGSTETNTCKQMSFIILMNTHENTQDAWFAFLWDTEMLSYKYWVLRLCMLHHS